MVNISRTETFASTVKPVAGAMQADQPVVAVAKCRDGQVVAGAPTSAVAGKLHADEAQVCPAAAALDMMALVRPSLQANAGC